MAKSKLWQRLYSEICKIRVIDSHWHTCTQREYEQRGGHDLFSLWAYFNREILALTGVEADAYFAQAKSDRQKWQLLKPLLARAGNTSYYRHNVVAYQELFGLRQAELNDRNFAAVNARIKQRTRAKGWYRQLIKTKCKMDMALLNVDMFQPDWEPEYSRPIFRLEPILYPERPDRKGADPANLKKLQRLTGQSVTSVAGLTSVLAKAVELFAKRGAVGIKLAHAYRRTLYHERVSKTQVSTALGKILRSQTPTDAQMKAYQDFVVFLLADLAGQFDLVFQIHTGLQGQWGHVPDCDPLGLCNLLREFPDTRFDLFHAGYPYSRQMGILAKHYPNVWADMCWMYVITMAGSRSTLDEWIDLIPGYRIIGFGSDVGWPELIYAHLRMGRQCMTDVLEKKVTQDMLSEETAVSLAKMMLRDNLIELFKLDQRAGLKKLCS